MVSEKMLKRREGGEDVFTVRKRLASLLILLFSRGVKPHPFFAKDSRLRELNRIFVMAIKRERDPLMKARWDALRKSVMWLVSHDGAYRVRLIWLLQEIAKNKKSWKVKPYEARF
jgi:hypothetical protein